MKPTMPPRSTSAARTRPISMSYLRAFDAVARNLNFRIAAEDLALTQSAVSAHPSCFWWSWALQSKWHQQQCLL